VLPSSVRGDCAPRTRRVRVLLSETAARPRQPIAASSMAAEAAKVLGCRRTENGRRTSTVPGMSRATVGGRQRKRVSPDQASVSSPCPPRAPGPWRVPCPHPTATPPADAWHCAEHAGGLSHRHSAGRVTAPAGLTERGCRRVLREWPCVRDFRASPAGLLVYRCW
jgi:hypothetical protein